LVRENTAHIRPPRALWVPFDLGRPFGAPNDSSFQLKVLRAVLALFERADGPVLLEDFPDDAPGQGDPENMEGLVCPVPLRKPASASQSDLIQAVLAETKQLAPWYELSLKSSERTTVGVSGLELSDAIRFIDDIRRTGGSKQINQDDWAATLRFATEDLRNYYLEAAAMRPGGAASHAQMIDWFWGETSAGELLLIAGKTCKTAAFEPLRAVPIVPRAQQHRVQNS
jgi:hypothetical protein